MSADSTSSKTATEMAWIVPFFVILTSAVVFFFSQMAQFNLLVH